MSRVRLLSPARALVRSGTTARPCPGPTRPHPRRATGRTGRPPRPRPPSPGSTRPSAPVGRGRGEHRLLAPVGDMRGGTTSRRTTLRSAISAHDVPVVAREGRRPPRGPGPPAPVMGPCPSRARRRCDARDLAPRCTGNCRPGRAARRAEVTARGRPAAGEAGSTGRLGHAKPQGNPNRTWRDDRRRYIDVRLSTDGKRPLTLDDTPWARRRPSTPRRLAASASAAVAGACCTGSHRRDRRGVAQSTPRRQSGSEREVAASVGIPPAPARRCRCCARPVVAGGDGTFSPDSSSSSAAVVIRSEASIRSCSPASATAGDSSRPSATSSRLSNAASRYISSVANAASSSASAGASGARFAASREQPPADEHRQQELPHRSCRTSKFMGGSAIASWAATQLDLAGAGGDRRLEDREHRRRGRGERGRPGSPTYAGGRGRARR